VQIVNGYDCDLAGASLDVTGIEGCDRPILAVPENSIAHAVCPVNLNQYLFAMTPQRR